MAKRVAKVGIGLLATAGVAVAGTFAVSAGSSAIGIAAPPPAQAEVAALVDGDTFDVRSNDQITRVRLEFVATPSSSGKPGKPPACLAPEAAVQLGKIIPPGTQLVLTYDTDRLGRTAAQATTPDGRMVNAEIVRAGLAEVVRDHSSSPVPPGIDVAAAEALANKRGVHASDIGCTVPGQVKTLTDQVAKLPATPPPGADVPVLVTAANSATEARMAAEELDSYFSQNRQETTWVALDPNERSQLEAKVKAAAEQAGADETALRAATNVAVNQNATQFATQRDAARIAKVLADIRRAEARRAAEAARRLEAARRAQAAVLADQQTRADAQRKRQNDSSQTDQPSSSGSSGSDSSSSSSSSKDSGSSGSESGSSGSSRKKKSGSSSGG